MLIQLALLTAVLIFLAFKLYINPIKVKAYYSKMFRANGYKVFQYPYQLTSVPFFSNMMKNLRQKKDFNYTGKNVYSDNYDIVITNIFNKPSLVVINEKFIKGFFEKDMQMVLPKFHVNSKTLAYFVKRGITVLEKNVWKTRRTLLSKVFNFDFISSQIPNMIHTSQQIFKQAQNQYWTSNPDQRQKKTIKLSLYNMIAKYTSANVIVGFLGLDLLKERLRGKLIQQQILILTEQTIRLSRNILVMYFGQKFLKLGLRKVDRELLAFNQEINALLMTAIRRYRQSFKNGQKSEKKSIKSIVQLIFQQIQKEKSSQNKDAEIFDQDLVDQIKTFVIAGSETTANYLTMLVLQIYEHKEVLDRLRTQIAKHIKSDQDITLENIKKIAYLDCVMSQSSRVFAAVESGFQRMLQQDYVFCGIPLKKGTCINLYTRPLFSNPHIFKDPLSFKPQRWQVQTQQSKKLLQLISFQFYGGPRSCIGKQVALTESKVFLIKFLRQYNLTEPGVGNRSFQLILAAHLIDSNVILQKRA